MSTIIGYQNHLETATVTATSSPAAHPVAHAYNYLTANYWAPGGGTSQMLIDLGSAKETDYVGIVAEDLGSVALEAFLTNPPPSQWQQRDSTFGSNGIASVIWDGTRFVAVGQDGRMAVSDDNIGNTWSARQVVPQPGPYLFDVAFNAGIYVAVGQGSGIYRSVDTLNWSSPVSPFASEIGCVIAANGMFIAAADSGEIATSLDGNQWTLRKIQNGYGLYTLTYGNGRFVAMGESNQLWTSEDGFEWQQQIPPWGEYSEFWSVTYDNGIFVCGGWGISGGMLYSSADGIAWHPLTTPLTFGAILSVVRANGHWVIGDDVGRVATSADGNVWMLSESGFGNEAINAFAFAGNTVVAVGGAGKLAISSTAPAWVNLWSKNPAENAVVMATFASVSAQSWRLSVTGTAPKVSHVSLGRRLTMPIALGAPFIAPKRGRKDRVVNAATQRGEFAGRSLIRRGYEFDMDFKLVDSAWMDSNFDAFIGHISAKPFFVLWDSENRPNEAAYAWLRDSDKLPAPRWVQSAYQDLSLDLEGKV